MRLLRGVLLASTMFVLPLVAGAGSAQAGPVVAFVAGAGAALFGGAPLVLGGLAATTSAYAAGAFAVQALIGVAGTALGGALINAAIGFALNAVFAPSYSAPQPKPQDLQANFMLADQPRFWAAGVNRLGGGITFAEAKDGRLYKQVAHCDSEATQELGLWLNDIQVTLDGSGWVEQDDFKVGSAAKIRIHRRPGTGSQAAQAVLTAAFSEWTDNHVGAGVCDTLMQVEPVNGEGRQKLYKHRGVLGLGEPDVTRLARFGRAHDPRNPASVAGDPSTWPANPGNPALTWAAYRMDAERFAMRADQINWASVAAAADICDQARLDRYGNSAPNYGLGIYVNKAEESNIDGENRILASFDGMRFEDEDGRFGVLAGVYMEPDVTLTDEDLFEVESAEADDGENSYSHFYAQYTEPGYGYKGQPSALWVWPEWEAGQAIKTTAVPLYPVQNHRQAVQLLKVAAHRQNERLRLGVVAGLRARRLRTRRTVRIVSASDPALSGVYEVGGFKREPGQFVVSLVLTRIRSDWWQLEAGEEGERPNLSVSVASDDSLTNIPAADMSISAISLEASGGQYVARFVAAFPPPERADRLVQLQMRRAGTTSWEELSVRSEDGAAASSVVSDGQDHEFRWRLVSLSGDASEWSAIVTRTAVADQTPPGAVSGLAAAVTGSSVALTWTTPASNYFATRIIRADYAAGYAGPYAVGDGVQVREDVGLPARADGWTDAGLAPGVHAYWAVPLNGSGIAGPASGPVVATVA